MAHSFERARRASAPTPRYSLEKVVVISSIVAWPLGWIVRRLGARTLLALTLLLVAVMSVALGLADLVRGLDGSLLLPVAALGVMLGWALGKAPLPGWLGGLLGFILGAEAIVLHVGGLGRPLMALLRRVIELAWGLLLWPLEGRPDTLAITLAFRELNSHASSILKRGQDWLLAVMQGEAAFDPMATALAWGLILWTTALWAGWVVRRHHRPLHGIAPAAALLLISLSYTWDDPKILYTLLGATLLLLAAVGQMARERRWQAAGIDYSPELRLDLALVTIPLTLLLLTATILIPSVSLRPIAKEAQRLLVERLRVGRMVADSMGLEPLAGEGVALDQVRAAGLPNRSLIGSGPELSKQVVMIVYLQENQPPPKMIASAADVPPQPYYWRSLTYDQYTGRGWQTSEIEKVMYRAGEPAAPQARPIELSPAEAASQAQPDTSTAGIVHQTLRQEMQAVGDLGGLLYIAGELVTADQDYRVAWRSSSDVFGAEVDAKVYRADSLIPIVSEAQLRSAGTAYPAWVVERYLALPSEIPERVFSLAQELTAREATPYEQARVIESYLRTFIYTLDLPAAPPNRDIADYFLFDLKKGYCDYYATTMVVLARAAGLPARLVQGYASGIYDEANERYVVTAADAHSWVEIYFPGYGWIEFEPTAGRPAIERPAETVLMGISTPPTALEPRSSRGIGPSQLLWLGPLGVVAFVLLGSIGWWAADGWRLWRSPPVEVVATLYQRLYRHGRRLAIPARMGDTPYEFAAALTEQLAELAQERRSGTDATLITQHIDRLTDLFVRGLYSSDKPDAAEKAKAIRTWRRLRRNLWWAWLWQKRRGK
jgi:transglutaminase-like putative cysteine protease